MSDKHLGYLFIVAFYIIFPLSAVKLSRVSNGGVLLMILISFIFSFPYLIYSFGFLFANEKWKIFLYYSVLPVFVILYLILGEIFENEPFRYGGLCSEGTWCWISSLLIFPLAFISLIIGIFRFFSIRS